MRKGKLGLQKEISRIFTGIMLPKKDAQDDASPPAASAPPAVPPSPPVSTQAPKSFTAAPKPPPPKPQPPKQVTPRPVPTPPKPFIIPEPTQQQPSNLQGQNRSVVEQNPVQTPQQKIPEKSVKIPSLYNPPVQKPVPAPPLQNVYQPTPPTANQNVYDPPPLPKPLAQEVKIEVVTKQKGASPILKIWEKISSKLFAAATSASSQGEKRKKVMLFLMPVLGLVMIYVVFNALKKPQIVNPVTPTGAGSSGSQIAFDGKIDWVVPPLYPDNLRDPTILGAVTPVAGQENAGRPPVKGIVFSDDNPIAVVGDRIVSVGEVVQGATVVKINKNSVEFEMGDKKWTQEVER